MNEEMLDYKWEQMLLEMSKDEKLEKIYTILVGSKATIVVERAVVILLCIHSEYAVKTLTVERLSYMHYVTKYFNISLVKVVSQEGFELNLIADFLLGLNLREIRAEFKDTKA